MDMKNFQAFSFFGTKEERRILAEIHRNNGATLLYSRTLTDYEGIYFVRATIYGCGAAASIRQRYFNDAKEYLMSFSKKNIEVEYVVDGIRYGKSDVNGSLIINMAKRKEQLINEIAMIDDRLAVHTWLKETRGFK